VDAGVAERILQAFERMAARPIGRLVEEELMECRSSEKAAIIATGPLKLPDEFRQEDRRALDDAGRRRELVETLYEQTARHFRKIRLVEIQKQEQRSRNAARRFTAEDLAADVWDAAALVDWSPLAEWLDKQPGPKSAATIPESGNAILMPATDMYDRTVVYFGEGRRAKRVSCESRTQAELLAKVAALGLRGSVSLPANEGTSRNTLRQLEGRLAEARNAFEGLARNRSGDEKTRSQIVDLLMHWFVQGRGRKAAGLPRAGTRQRRKSASATPSR
jgi:hypothetical protein